jgi:hypothetical protein
MRGGTWINAPLREDALSNALLSFLVEQCGDADHAFL